MPIQYKPCSRCYHPVAVKGDAKGDAVLCHKHQPAEAKPRKRATKKAEPAAEAATIPASE